ncbi:MAG TPA: VOC family protein [Candidatus Limnocylindria bacterium]
MAIPGVRYGHTNLVAHEWRRLATFYQETFGCTPVPPERDYRSPDRDRGPGLTDAPLPGVHLRLPGWGDDGPTLEIYGYDELLDGGPSAVNRTGWGHIAFAVDDVESARDRVLEAGGASVGEIVTLQTADGRRVTWCYLTDPEGNIIELQSWSPAA